MIPYAEFFKKKTRQNHSFSFSSMYRSLFGVLGFLLIVFLFLLPVIRLILLSFSTEEGISFALYQEVLSNKVTWTTIQNTLTITIGSTLLSIMIGVLFAWVVAYVNIRGKKWMQLFIFMPFIIPSYVTTLAWVQFLGNNGPVQFVFDQFSIHKQIFNLYSIEGMIFILGLTHYPLVYLFTVNVFRKIPRELIDAARVGGASNGTIFRKIIFKMALPGIAGGGLLAFLSNLDNFGIPAFLGIPANIRVLSTYIYEQVIGFGPSAFARASVLSVLLGVIAIIGTAIQWLILRKNKVSETTKADYEPRYFLAKGPRILFESILWIFLLVTSLVPFLTMAATSFIKAYGLSFKWENLSLKNYHFLLFEDAKTLSAVGNSLTLATITAFGCLIIGTAIAYLRFKRPTFFIRMTEIIVTVPYALPGTVFALAIILMWLQPLPNWQPGIYGTIWILLIAYMTRFTILQVRGSLTAFSQMDPSMEEAAQTAGANLFVKWKEIFLPILFPGIIAGTLLVFLTALTELTVSSLLWSSGSETIGVVIFSYEQSGFGTYSTAFSTLIVLVILLTGVLYLVLEKMWKKRVVKQK